uniref:Pheromone binding protein 2 n=1 Tax=Argyresthia conjugella TaxID=687015 RepID=H9N4S4_9NEOP|nr:pheromone binding protein 2 [Argyresthia conjugella]
MKLLLLMSLMMMCLGIEASKQTMKDIHSGCLKVLQACKHELNLPDHIITDFYHYWKEDYTLLNRDTGCAIICMAKKLDLIDASGKLHHGNAQEFAEKHGADNSMSSQLVQIVHGCEKQFEAVDDDCLRVLEIAKCFRTNIHQLDWAPTMDVIIEEVLTEI